MRNITLLAPANLDPDRIDQDQPIELGMATHRDLGGNPAAK